MKDVINTAKDKMGKCVAAVETEYASILSLIHIYEPTRPY